MFDNASLIFLEFIFIATRINWSDSFRETYIDEKLNEIRAENFFKLNRYPRGLNFPLDVYVPI